MKIPRGAAAVRVPVLFHEGKQPLSHCDIFMGRRNTAMTLEPEYMRSENASQADGTLAGVINAELALLFHASPTRRGDLF